NALAILAGSLLVRSYERSERIYKAMILRGYGRAKISYEEFQARPYDLQVMALMIAVATGFVIAELAARGL
ncbi:MAG TPA: CbiQ family ECF transporter T component, partial [Anaerolineae bacterium]|nr:CbiQ family ECF transporter T component [Anaerolineae bacterium]